MIVDVEELLDAPVPVGVLDELLDLGECATVDDVPISPPHLSSPHLFASEDAP